MRILLYIAGIVAAICLLYTFNSWIGIREDAFFTSALHHANVPLPSGTSLKEKELLYAQTLAAQNPLVALPGADLANIDNGVAQLGDVEHLMYTLNASSTNAKLLYSLYPVHFLQALSSLESARRTFVASGSEADEKAYESAATKAFSAYQADASAFVKAFAAAVPENSGTFATDGDSIGRADALSAISKLQRSMQTTAALFADREQCTHGAIQKCNAGDLRMPEVTITPEVPVAPQNLAQAKTIRALLAQAHDQEASAEGPMLLLPSTECAPHMSDGAPLFGFYTPGGSPVAVAPFPQYIGNIRFDSANASSSAAYARFSAAMHQQITYILDSPILHYSCFEMAHDSGKLFAMEDTYAFAQAQKVSTYATSSATKAALMPLEQKNVALLTQHEAESYLSAANRLTLPSATKATLQEITLSYLFNSAHFDANIAELTDDEDSNGQLIENGWPIDLGLPYMFFIRSSFSMLLLADNQSAVGTESGGNLKLFPPDTIPQNQQPFIYYSELPHTAPFIETLIHDIHFFYIIHRDPSLVSGLPKS